jgi:hypothetical protein
MSTIVATHLGVSSAIVSGPGTWAEHTTSVSCDGSTIKDAGTYDLGSDSGLVRDLYVRQESATTQSSTTKVFLRSTEGNDTPTFALTNGETTTMIGVLPSNYHIKAYRSGAKNCNGGWAGHGNYSWHWGIASGSSTSGD